jgi:hypothetical protein
LSELDSPTRSALITELDEALIPLKQDGGFAIPIEANVVLARR